MIAVAMFDAWSPARPGPTRRAPPLRPILGALLLALAAAIPARAHDFTLLPSAGSPAPDAPFELGMHVGDLFPGETVPWRVGHVAEFAVIDARGRRDIETPEYAGTPPRARLELRLPGTAVIALATDPSYLTLEGPKFEAYLAEEGYQSVIETRRRAGRSDAPGRERYSRHVKTIVNAAGPSSSVALTRAGLTIEIVPETDLAGLHPGGRLPVRVFFRGAAYAGGRLCASHAGWGGGEARPYAWCGELDGAGRATVPIAAPGWQLLRAAHMIAIRDDPKADWESFWTSLTFEVAETPAPAGAGRTGDQKP